MSTQNEFTVNGVRYVAVPAPNDPKCDGCAFYKQNCTLLPPCGMDHRRDGRNVIFRAVPTAPETTAAAAVTTGEVKP